MTDRNIILSLVQGASNPEIIGTSKLYDLLKLMTENEGMKKEGALLRKLYRDDKPNYKTRKDEQNGFIVGLFDYRAKAKIKEYVPVFAFDIDSVQDEKEYEELTAKLRKWKYSFLVMPSISGVGIRFMVVADCCKKNHNEYISLVAKEASTHLGIKLRSDIREGLKLAGLNKKQIDEHLENVAHLDDKTLDYSRFWFYSGLERNEIYLNKKSAIWRKAKPQSKSEKDYPYNFTQEDKANYLVKKIEQTNIDITSGVVDWFKIGCSLADEFKESGRSLFHAVSKYHKDYVYKKCDSEYDRCLAKTHRNTISIATFFKFCKDYGVGIDWGEMVKEYQHKFPTKKIASTPIAKLNQLSKVDEQPNDAEENPIDKLLSEVESKRFSIEKKPAKPNPILHFISDDITAEKFALAGFNMIGLIQGQTGTGKSLLIQLMEASALSGGNEKMNYFLNLGDKKILNFDTEQAEYFFYKNRKMTYAMAQVPKDNPNYYSYPLRKYSAKERLEIINYIVRTTENIGLIVIDGIVDLLNDFNNIEESTQIINWLLEITDLTGALLITIIHTAGTGDAKGHLGKLLLNKVDFAINISLNKDLGEFSVRERKSRFKPFPPFTFTRNSEGFPESNRTQNSLSPYYDISIFKKGYTKIDSIPEQQLLEQAKIYAPEPEEIIIEEKTENELMAEARQKIDDSKIFDEPEIHPPDPFMENKNIPF